MPLFGLLTGAMKAATGGAMKAASSAAGAAARGGAEVAKAGAKGAGAAAKAGGKVAAESAGQGAKGLAGTGGELLQKGVDIASQFAQPGGQSGSTAPGGGEGAAANQQGLTSQGPTEMIQSVLKGLQQLSDMLKKMQG